MLAFAAGLLFTSTDAGVASAASNGAWSIFPYHAPGASGPGRSLFDFSLKAGQSIADAFTLSNDTSHPITFNIYPADAYDVAAGGGFALRGFGQQDVGVGAWVHLPKSVQGQYTLAQDSQVTVPFTLAVPSDASPGDHAGGIVALALSPAAGSKSRVRFTVRQGVGVRVYLHVLGAVLPGLAVENLKTDVSVPPAAFLTGSSKAGVSYEVVNTGNKTFLSVVVRTYATNIFGQTVQTFRPVRLATVLPGSRETITQPEWSPLPLAGPVTVHVQLLATRVNHKYTSSFWVVPWLLIVVVLLVLGALIAFLWRLWRRRKASQRHAPDPNAEEPAWSPVPATTDGSETEEILERE